MRIIVKTPVNINGIIYNKGDEIKKCDKSLLIKLNERGYIEPLTMKDIQDYGKEEKPRFGYKKNEKEE